MISARPASLKRVIPPGESRLTVFLAVGCAVRWLAERRPDPHNGERDHDEDRDNNLAPHCATVARVRCSDGDGLLTAVWLFGSSCCANVLCLLIDGCMEPQRDPGSRVHAASAQVDERSEAQPGTAADYRRSHVGIMPQRVSTAALLSSRSGSLV